MSGSDERNQSEALLAMGIIVSLWLSHGVVLLKPEALGNYDLSKILKFWNTPIWINWLAAAAFFLIGSFLGKRLLKWGTIWRLKKKQKEAEEMGSKLNVLRGEKQKYQAIR